MRHLHAKWIIGLLLTAGLAVSAEPADREPEPDREAVSPADLEQQIDLPKLIRLGVARSPRLKTARAKWQATIEKIPQAKALPDPKVVFDYFGESVETRVGPQEYRYGVSQSFPWPGTLGKAGDLAAKEVRIQHAEYDRAMRDLIVDLKVSYHELLFLRGAIEITRQNQELLEHILKITQANYADGAAKLNDVLKAQSQVAQLSYDMILLRELEQVEMGKLNAMLDLPTAHPLGEAKRPPLVFTELSVADLEETAVSHRQEIEIAQRKVEKTEAAIRLATLKNRPSFSLNAMRIETGEADMDVDESGKDPWLIGIGVSIPLWFDSNRSRVKEMEYEREAAVSSKRELENTTRSSVKSIFFRLENARRLIELYEKSLIPQARQAMEVAEQWHDRDQQAQDVSGFLETQSVWLNFNLARLRAATDYQQYKARLERLIGGPLPAADSEAEAGTP